ncbi:MAG TPA: hypothetical protein VH092_19980 [Urbifossiella sp.]|nr:hypothetical protein [Urbifossiella sp.]
MSRWRNPFSCPWWTASAACASAAATDRKYPVDSRTAPGSGPARSAAGPDRTAVGGAGAGPGVTGGAFRIDPTTSDSGGVGAVAVAVVDRRERADTTRLSGTPGTYCMA